MRAMNVVGTQHFANILFCLAPMPAFDPKISPRASPPGMDFMEMLHIPQHKA